MYSTHLASFRLAATLAALAMCSAGCDQPASSNADDDVGQDLSPGADLTKPVDMAVADLVAQGDLIRRPNGFDDNVDALLVVGPALYAGGAFTAYQGVAGSARRLAKLDLSSGALDMTFSPLALNGFDNTVNTLATLGAALYAGGTFTAYRGAAASTNALARLDLTSGALDGAFSPAAANGLNGPVNALLVSGSLLVAGGSFDVSRGAPPSVYGFRVLDATTGDTKQP